MQSLIVGLIVLVALVFTVWRFMPARWRHGAAARLGLSARAANAGSCHACDDCAGCGTEGQVKPKA